MSLAAELLQVAPEVAAALADGKAVVALESTVISHGMPYPDNVATALALEEIVRSAGAVPATVAVMDSRIRVGLKPTEIERLGTGAEPVAKLSRRDLPIALALGEVGATTVAATMLAARLAGIEVFATGGIGGAHRGAQQTFDISADLAELARSRVAVVCAGAKAILDLPMTLEILETLGVPVLGYGTDSFPAFFTRRSALAVDARVDSPEEVARICAITWALGLSGGVLVANPVAEADAMDEATIEAAIASALHDATAAGIAGKALTPYLLARVNELTSGSSLKTNVALIRSNAGLAARIAGALTDLRKDGSRWLPPLPSA
jgi:pseudouridine-5'-phosphate glycosidase